MAGRRVVIISLAVISFLVLTIDVSFACTDFQIKAKDNSIVIGRSMEFPVDLHSRVVIVPRGRQFNSVNDKGIKGISWTNKYGFLGVDAFKVKNAYLEGFNEKGLAFDALMFTGAEYQPAVAGEFVTISDFGSWVMGNFATVDEVKQALPKVKVAGIKLKEANGELYLHIALHDANGKNLVIEFINGEIKVYDNPLGVMTNRPDFAWQMNNLRNYINLDAHDIKDKTLNGVKIEPAGVGSGMLGLPGDWTPPSRFVKMAICISAVLAPENSGQAINLAQHLLNTVDIPKGVIKENPEPLITLEGYAQWVVIKDLTNLVLYYKTYDNLALKKVDLKRFDLTANAAERSIAINDMNNLFIDVTSELK